MSVLQEAGHIKNTVVLTFRHIQCLHMMYAEVAWVLLFLGTEVQPQKILNPNYLPCYRSVSYDYDGTYAYMTLKREYNYQKQSLEGVLQNIYSNKYRKLLCWSFYLINSFTDVVL